MTVPKACPNWSGTLNEAEVSQPGDRAQNRAYRHGGHAGHTDVHGGQNRIRKSPLCPRRAQ